MRMTMKRYLSIFLALAVLAACQKEEPLLTGPVGGNGQEETGGNGGNEGGSGDEGGDVNPPATTGYAWFELPAIVDDDKDGKLDDGNELYYALLRTKSGASGKSVRNCSASELQCAAFVLRHNVEKSHKPQAEDIISIADLEKITGFTYFRNVPNAPKTTVNKNEWL